ncbi:CUB domain protein [Teladorsagia circumcincta]|uniref:CUB domain protein n=1 Tax=Teladorsagia circumcincta TaxID=45464 RepID=A0A2G9UNN2_TELCI|nr:CUB domain protein [Teladorsagia circumcincta]
MYPPNTTCSYILDGLQGDQNLEKVIVTFEEFAVLSDDDSAVVTDPPTLEDITCPAAWVGVATSDATMKATLSSTDESNFEATLCERIPSDFGVAGEPMGTSNECLFRFRSPMGFFNSPRYPANVSDGQSTCIQTFSKYSVKMTPLALPLSFLSFGTMSFIAVSVPNAMDRYPLDTNCTYFIEGEVGQQILIHFEQFALFGEQGGDRCKDWLEIYDVFHEGAEERLALRERYCSDTFPGPTVSAFGAHSMRVIFSSDSTGTGNGFKALYEIRPAAKEDIPTHESVILETKEPKGDGAYRCGRRIRASATTPTGYVMSPNYPIKYNKDVHCDWEISARDGHKILLTMVKMEIEGEMSATTASCQKLFDESRQSEWIKGIQYELD